MTKNQKEEWEAEKAELEGTIKERDKQINKAIEEHQKKEQEQKARIEKEIEKQKLEKEREAEIARLQGEDQKALLSAEKTEIEQLKAERNELRNTTEEQEKFLSRWIKEYDRLELEKAEAIHQVLKYDAVIKQRDSEIRETNSRLTIIEDQHTALSADKEKLQEQAKNLDQQINTWKGMYVDMEISRNHWEKKHNDLETEKLTINQRINQLETEKAELENEKVILEAQVNDLEADKQEWKKNTKSKSNRKELG